MQYYRYMQFLLLPAGAAVCRCVSITVVQFPSSPAGVAVYIRGAVPLASCRYRCVPLCISVVQFPRPPAGITVYYRDAVPPTACRYRCVYPWCSSPGRLQVSLCEYYRGAVPPAAGRCRCVSITVVQFPRPPAGAAVYVLPWCSSPRHLQMPLCISVVQFPRPPAGAAVSRSGLAGPRRQFPGRVLSNWREEERGGRGCWRGETGDRAGHSLEETGMETWYHLPAEQDASGFAPPTGETLSPAEQTEFPSMEEGTLHSEKRPAHSIQLEIQDSRYSPCLPLLTFDSAQGQKFFDDTLYQQTEMDFAPLCASLDMSEFPLQPSLQISDAVALAGKEVSLDLAIERVDLAAGDASSIHGLSQYLLPDRHVGGVDHIDLSSYTMTEGDRSKSLKSKHLSSQEELDKVFNQGDGSFLDSCVPAPELLELLEKEVGLSGSSQMSSGRSSTQTVSSKETEIMKILQDSESQQQTPNISDLPVFSETPRKTSLGELEGETFRDSSEVHFFNAETFENSERENEEFNKSSQFNRSGITVRSVPRPSSETGRVDLQRQLCSEIQQHYQEKELLKASEVQNKTEEGSSLTPTSLDQGCSPKPSHEKETTVIEDQSSVSRDELTSSSRCSIERGHKDTGISPADRFPVEDASFIGRLAQPISQSTPGAFSVANVRKQLAGRLMEIKAKLTGSEMSLNEEPSSSSSTSNAPPCGKPQSAQSSHGYPGSSDSQRSTSPQRKRIQSLPCLNYIEKVGAWNTNQSFDALVLRGLTGVSPKKKAFSAVADSLNRMLAKQAGGSPPKRGLAASFIGASSMTSLNVHEKEPSSSALLTRSQSYNSVVTVGTEKREGPIIPPLKETVDKSQSDAVQECETLTEAEQSQSTDPVETSTANNEKPADRSLQKKDLAANESIRGAELDDDKLSPNEHRGSRGLAMGQFSDVSLENDFLGSSGSTDPMINAASVHSLTSLEVDNFVPDWSPAKTPEKKEINIEERIPTYLRNLGIDQSPTTILKPFAPKGPIREPEFSPSDLRTIKGSTATPTRSMPLSEGDSQSAVNISQSSNYSTASTTSISIPMGSEAGPETPLATEVSPSFSSRSTNDRPISQYDANSLHVLSHLQLPPTIHGEDTGGSGSIEQQTNEVCMAQPLPPSQPPEEEKDLASELKRVRKLIEQFESGDDSLTQSRHSLEESQSNLTSMPKASEAKQTMDSTNDSFVGSKTLKEIRKLLAEADAVGLDESGVSFPPLKDSYSLSPATSLKLDDSLKSDALQDRPAGQIDMSWDASFNSSTGNDDSVTKGFPGKPVSSWENSLVGTDASKGSFLLEEVVENDESATARLQGRFVTSEAECCNEPTDNRLVNTPQILNDPRVTAKEAERTHDLLSSVASAVGGLEQALDQTGVASMVGREQVPESDDSSADSLAVRVMSLLKSDAPFTQTSQDRQEDRRGRGSLKLKLASQPLLADADLNAEDRRRIEEIKRELLEEARHAQLAENTYHTGDDILDQQKDGNNFRLQITPSPISGQSSDSDVRSTTWFVPPASGQAYPHHTKVTAFSHLPSSKVPDQSRLTPSFHQPEKYTDLPNLPRIGTPPSQESKSGGEYDALITSLPPKSSEDTKRPITSITFASRKRFSPLSSSVGSETDYKEQYPDQEPPGSGRNLTKDTVDFSSRSINGRHMGSQQNTRISQVTNLDDVLDLPRPLTSEEQKQSNCVRKSPIPYGYSGLNQEDVAASLSSSLNGEGFAVVEQSSEPTLVHQQESDIPSRGIVKEGYFCVLDQDLQKVDNRSLLSTQSSFPKDNIGTNPSFPNHHATPEPSNTSMGRKALSCIHLTISPKQDTLQKIDFDHELPGVGGTSSSMNTFLEDRRWAEVTENSGSKLSASGRSRSFQDLSRNKETEWPTNSYFLHSPTTMNTSRTEKAGHIIAENDSHRRVAAMTPKRAPLSDATTQITTESPVKTTFSAEIFIESDGKENKIPEHPNVKSDQTPEKSSYRPQIPYLTRATDQPVLLPYRPPGSPELFYVPYPEGVSRMSPTSTIESSHPGSIDAISPKFPAEVLGSASKIPSESSIPKHREGIYSKHRGPAIAWTDKPPAGIKDDLELRTRLHNHTPAVKHTPQNDPYYGSFLESSYESLRHRGSCSRNETRDGLDGFKERPGPSSYHEDNDFFPLKPEFDESQDLHPDPSLRRKIHNKFSEVTQLGRDSGRTLNSQATDITGRKIEQRNHLSIPRSHISSLNQSQREQSLRDSTLLSTLDYYKQSRTNDSALSHSASSNQSLDDLWARFTDRRKSPLSVSSNKLEMSLVERLERLSRLLHGSPSQSLFSDVNQIQEGTWNKENGGSTKRGERLYQNNTAKGGASLGGMEISSHVMGSTLHRGQYGDRFSDGSVDTEVRSSETETATQTDSETVRSSSLSTIDTVRLINAFGPERVRPSSTLSHLYNTINLQKKRTEISSSRRPRRPSGAGAEQESTHFYKSYNKVNSSDSGSASTSSGVWEPNAALRSKRTSKLLNKGIQTGDLEIVTGATKRNTRDVGTTFPSPASEQPKLRGHAIKEDTTWNNGLLNHRGRKSRTHVPRGLSWFVPAEDLRTNSRKENEKGFNTVPSLAWYEPFTHTKPWREPLKEKHFQEQSLERRSILLNRSGSENKTPNPFTKVTLQESLQNQRPDFIFRSGERVKRLQLQAKERKLQATFQNEREELFNQPGRRRGNQGTKPNKGNISSRRERAIPKKEMVQRAKRAYEQLPEIRKRKEDEKRRSEYESYRLKAQVFRKKVTNHILGRKTPWN
ncbi:centrosome-associated protein ALMS1 [Pelodytes ibericus]